MRGANGTDRPARYAQRQRAWSAIVAARAHSGGNAAPRWSFFLPAVYVAHLCEEWWGAPGFSAWTRATLGAEVSPSRFLVINAVALLLFTLGIIGAVRSSRLAWLAAAFLRPAFPQRRTSPAGNRGIRHVLSGSGDGCSAVPAARWFSPFFPVTFASKPNVYPCRLGWHRRSCCGRTRSVYVGFLPSRLEQRA